VAAEFYPLVQNAHNVDTIDCSVKPATARGGLRMPLPFFRPGSENETFKICERNAALPL
jgi:hypothetical protein